jgi:hypothetical protein
MECVDACVAVEASEPASLELSDASATSFDASSTPRCPEPPFPCERLCWELDARFGRGRSTTLTSIDTSDDTDLATIGEPLVRCAEARAAECRADDAAPAIESTPDASLSWTSLFLECAGLPASLGLLD